MADLDPNVQALLGVLDDTPSGGLADAVREAIRSIDEALEEKLRYPRDRALRQMKLANEIVDGFIERELQMTKRLKVIAGEFRIDAIFIGADEGDPVDDLLADQRRNRLLEFQKTWGALYRDIVAGVGGQDGFQG